MLIVKLERNIEMSLTQMWRLSSTGGEMRIETSNAHICLNISRFIHLSGCPMIIEPQIPSRINCAYFFLASFNLASLGTGDDTRAWVPPSLRGQSCYFLAVNRNKKSVALNLAHREGQALARRLAKCADVLLENFKVGQMAKFGLDYERLADENPRLVYCSVTGER